ncbi:SprT family protein [Streptococcus merionis]|uniref:Protein SprT-like n=1 Tax=Streptococcus merionis TaxID=400065 RepID=A0A239SUA1_9STRE|nr:SprT family protein [Streptococcus merionis]SNU89010.1 SprT family metallopeptidase [Streptococcus merionis]
MNLTDYVKQVSLEDFGKAFKHTAHWNKRLRSTGGRFFPKDGHLDFNPKIYEEHGLAIFRQIVRHELCHYHLYFEKKGYRHTDQDFKQLLTQVDGLRYAPALPNRQIYKRYHCQTCGMQYFRKRRINTANYRCGKCRGLLVFDGEMTKDVND